MQPSVTYIHLLRHTPFFTSLSTSQLQWVIDHSREWEAKTGTVIAKVGPDSSSPADYWILLDGGWRVEHNDSDFPSGHAAPGKWFNTQEAQGVNCALVTTEESFVMRITAADMREMLEKGFSFNHHLADGRTYYDLIFHRDHPSRGAAR